MMQQKKIIGRRYKECTMFAGICVVLAFYMTWCLSTIAYRGYIFEVLHFVSTLITAFLYVCCIMTFQVYWRAPHLGRQLQILNFGILAAFVLIILSDMREASRCLLLTDLIWIIATGYSWRVLACSAGKGLCGIWSWLKTNWDLVILLAAAGIAGVFPTMLQFRWDGALYEQACRTMDIHSMSSLGAYAHLAQGYGVLFCLVNAIVPDTGYAMAVTNMVMYLASIVAFWGIMRQIVPGKSRWSYLMLAAMYACSPYTLGMVNYYSLDYATLCLFVCMLYFWLRREWILQFAAALFACFTKEPAIVSYGALCVGLVVVEIVQQQNTKVTERIGSLFRRLYYYPMLLTGVLWVITYLFLGGWNAGNGGTALDAVYMADKLKVLYVFNFSWIFTGIIILCSTRLVTGRTGKQNTAWWFVPLIVSTVGFTLFSIVFRTVNHARYAAQIPAVLYMIGGYLLFMVLKEKAAGIIVGILACLMLASSYLAIDPVSRLCFPVLDTGRGQMFTTGSPAPGDSMIYNKQMLDMEFAMNEAVGYAVDHDCMVIMPMYGSSPNIFDGLMQEMETQEYGCSARTYWSVKDSKRTNYEGGDTVPFIIYEWSSTADISQLPLQDKDRHCYIYSSMLGEDRAQQIRKHYADAEYKEYEYGGWTISVLVF